MLTGSISCGLWPCTDLMNNKKLQLHNNGQEQWILQCSPNFH